MTRHRTTVENLPGPRLPRPHHDGTGCLTLRTLLVFLLLTPVSALANKACEPQGDVAFICGIHSAEDLVRVPGSRYVIASGRESADAGTLYAIDSETRQHVRLFPGQQPERTKPSSGDSACSGPINQFQPHGVSIKQVSGSSFTLYVVGHGQREAIEIFHLTIEDKAPELVWTGCIPAPERVERFNAVTALPGDAIAVTNLPPHDSLRRGTGEIWQWQKGNGWSVIPGGKINGANGIVASPDGESLYVAEYFSESLLQISLGKSPLQVKTFHVGYSIDNIRWSDNGKLLLTAHARNCQANGQCDYGAPGTQVLTFDPATENLNPLFYYPTQKFFPVGTVTEAVNGELWMGGIGGTDRIVVFSGITW